MSSISLHVISIRHTEQVSKPARDCPRREWRSRYELIALKTRKFSLAVLLKSTRAKTDLERATKKRLCTRYYLFRFTRSRSHEYRASYVRSKAKGEKRKIMRRRIWHHDLPGDTRATGMDRRMNGRYPKKLSPLYQMEVYRDTGDFSRYQDIRQVSRKKPEKERRREREKRMVLSFSFSHMHCSRIHSHSLTLTTFHDFLLSPRREGSYSGEHVGRVRGLREWFRGGLARMAAYMSR